MHNVFIILILQFEMMIWNDDTKCVDQAITNLSWFLPWASPMCGIRYTNPEYEKESHVIVEPRTAREWPVMEEKEEVKR